jgi:hypothetical protein
MIENDLLDESLQPIWAILRIHQEWKREMSEKIKFLEEEVVLLQKELEKVGSSECPDK